jgi:hypothetical protein
MSLTYTKRSEWLTFDSYRLVQCYECIFTQIIEFLANRQVIDAEIALSFCCERWDTSCAAGFRTMYQRARRGAVNLLYQLEVTGYRRLFFLPRVAG